MIIFLLWKETETPKRTEDLYERNALPLDSYWRINFSISLALNAKK